MNGELNFALIVSLFLTLALEIGFFFALGKRDRQTLLCVVFANIMTNPAVVLTYWLALMYTDMPSVLVKAALELSAVFVEGFVYQRYGRAIKHPYLFSAAANVFSFGVGSLLQLLI